MKEIYLLDESTQTAAGPYPVDQIKELLANGDITPAQSAAENENGPWKPVKTLLAPVSGSGGSRSLPSPQKKSPVAGNVRINYKSNARYFRGKPGKGLLVWTIIGLILTVTVLFSAVGIPILLVAGGLWLYKKLSTMTDAEIDAQAQSFSEADLADENVIFEKLGVDGDEVAAAEPMSFLAYHYGPSEIGDPLISQLNDIEGDDERWRSPEVSVNRLLFSENALHYYSNYHSLVSKSFKEVTGEIFYKDIVSIEAGVEYVTWKSRLTANTHNFVVNLLLTPLLFILSLFAKPKYIRSQYFVVNSSSGKSHRCWVEDSAQMTTAVTALRALLRLKKNAV